MIVETCISNSLLVKMWHATLGFTENNSDVNHSIYWTRNHPDLQKLTIAERKMVLFFKSSIYPSYKK